MVLGFTRQLTSARLAYIWTSGDEAYTESDVQLVEEEFDMGDLIRIEKLPVPAKKEKMTLEQLKKDPTELIETTHQVVKELYPLEHKNVIASLQLLSDNKAVAFKRKTPLVPETYVAYVEPAKKLAIELSWDHKPTRRDEKERILSKGGKIEKLIIDGK